ncbi:MAG TPA: ATP-binding cassette domain-containing protein [Spirochaetia bacterium]|nr:ATP-binding cassette domain-containing protein [Spirochaetia bacterium]
MTDKASHNGATAAELVGVGLWIGGKPILRGITWQVGPGEKWAVLGLNGSGKTTLLKLLSGYRFPSRGTVRILGETLGSTDVRALRKRVGWVHGDLAPEFPLFMSAAEVVASGTRGVIAVYDDGPEARSAAVRDALRSVAALHLAGRPFHQLSTGERQRVLIARALAARPELLLLDEPCAGLDPVAREGLLRSLEHLFETRPSLTVVSVTHHVEEIVRGYSRVLLLGRGRVAGVGPRDQVMREETLAGIFGPECRVSRRDGRYSLSFRRDGSGSGGRTRTGSARGRRGGNGGS